MLALLIAHLVAAAAAPLLVRWWGRQAFLVLALVPAAGFAWVMTQVGTVTGGGEVRETTPWVPTLDLELAFRLDALSLTLAALVTGVGALVLLYCARYFEPDDEGIGRFAGVMTAFAGSMLGLVLADDLLLLYVFWELTTVFSYLLIGGSGARLAARRAASQALILTTAGGLAMLIGLLMIGETSGSYLLSEVVANPGDGPFLIAGTVLVLVGAITKSALIPFHFWLPAAMEAPTPVSAYLHAAAMVKAGVYLVARFAPGFAEVPGWRPLVLVLGLATMLVGGYRAIRQNDLKLLLAFGTVSQLGFLVVLVGAGSQEMAAAGLAMVVAHALFKSTLFLTVGVVDHATGTRDLRVLSGLGRRLPVLAVIGGLAGASMAGVPPLLGFVGKEAAFTALLDGGLPDRTTALLELAGLVLGSVITAAYTFRFLWGAFTRKPGCADTELVHPPAALFLAAPAVLALASLVLGPASPLLEPLAAGYAEELPLIAPEAEKLALWHGLQPALALSAVTLLGGYAVFALRAPINRFQRRVAVGASADEGYWNTLQGLDRLSVLVTGTTQRGSLPAYLGTILVVVIALPGSVLLFRAPWPGEWRAWDSPIQALVGAVALIAAVLALRIRQRLSAVLVVGVTGYALAVLFALQGAPDLALTQFLVETLTLVVFVLVLRKLPKDITDRHRPRERAGRGVIAVAVGVLMAAAGAVAMSARTATPVSVAYPDEAYRFGGGQNIVNVTLVDIRAWDTLGELSLVVVAATGVASLVFLRRRTGAVDRLDPVQLARQERSSRRAPRGQWLSATAALAPERRSVILEVITRILFHTILVFSLFLLFSGHNEPGGGFAGGLVAGLALVLRYLAGGRYELGEAAPVDPGLLLGAGLLFAGGTGVVGLMLGAEVLQTAILENTFPVLGDVKLVTSLFFDIGVYLIVVGLVLDILRSLGAELDRQADEDDPIDVSPGEVIVR
ncbi:multisubunit sodium/proton antiporter, MrpA subunit (TC 2.A.63.1)/multisubunit sodium/proton antiporter, MrpB subunit (TC 2.A.63.1) [Blastococcus aurantiacus]|uniref:Multisubunit sodium/proton antiporter, MrpA subunit (TC 2.A.63.1)/multisubunit sodium/proton antiporter, MrpB subunit (TC 2.A.63.1) n=1 Tax=Blastococcus aurantiacus TaxID=1550231 RepID=A0A1G7MM02_9ACTN|nr:Na+/H+ antiporter subunit A [Blastococcus aurantiacus]SDF62825.1 multisubunit sodium/proton antiporter, MrpA subunit (TC 2.A.63.1)/multisubunit sodium/proton antiporter, MrpB subunit (TC 2.A.63.1) [Blastococcus aurantiacus]